MKRLVYLLLLIGSSVAAQPCYVPKGALSWDNPSTFNSSTDRVLIFARKVPLGEINYINIELPTQDPDTYGTPDTNLVTLEGTIPASIQYENDPLAMLIYNDTGEYVNFSGYEDSTYFFAAFNVADGVYSNARYARGQTIAVPTVFDIIMANAMRTQWIKALCCELDTVIVVASSSELTYAPTGYASQYLTGLSNDYATSTAYLNGSDDTDGKVLYVDFGDRTFYQSLPEGLMYISVITNQDSCWSKPVTRQIDTR